MAYGTVNVGQAQNKDYIEESQKGKPNGVASLGPDGKVPEAQLPEMDVSQTLAQAELKDPAIDSQVGHSPHPAAASMLSGAITTAARSFPVTVAAGMS